MTLPILVGTDGHRRMGKSLGNYIGVAEASEAQFGKIMSIPDEPMRLYFTLLTDLPLAEVDRWLGPEVNPRDAKEVLARAIVAQYHGSDAAEAAALAFRRRARGAESIEVPTRTIHRGQLDADGCMPIGKLLKELGLAASSSEGSRLVTQGAVRIGPERSPLERDGKKSIKVTDGMSIWVGQGNKTRAAQVKLIDS
jgi:tyrosyl-tRNA synthetase